MAQGMVSVGEGWTPLTQSDTTTITVTNRGPHPIEVLGTVGANPPENDDQPQGILIERGVGFVGRSLPNIFPGLTGVNRLYARLPDSTGGRSGSTTSVFVSYA